MLCKNLFVELAHFLIHIAADDLDLRTLLKLGSLQDCLHMGIFRNKSRLLFQQVYFDLLQLFDLFPAETQLLHL